MSKPMQDVLRDAVSQMKEVEALLSDERFREPFGELRARAASVTAGLARLHAATVADVDASHDVALLAMREDNATASSFRLCAEVLKRRALPVGFCAWGARDPDGTDGWTVLHCAALHGRWPAEMDDAALVNWRDGDGLSPLLWRCADGATVAHVAAQGGVLPRGFVDWDARDNDGDTVAHTAGKFNSLPDDFDRWDLFNPDELFRNVGLPRGVMEKVNAWHAARGKKTRPAPTL